MVDVIERLRWLGHDVTIHDPYADEAAARHEYGLTLSPDAIGGSYDVVVPAVAHRHYRQMGGEAIGQLARDGGLVADLHGIWRDAALPDGVERWSL